MTRLQPASIRIAVATGLLLVLAGCTTIPAPLEGEYSDFLPEQAVERSVGAEVRWGGTVVETRPQSNETCVEVLARELDRSYRPTLSDSTHGRFLACREVFLDPEVFVNGREVTIVGRISDFETGSIGEFSYNYPRVNAESIYLWPERVAVHPYYRSHLYWGGPFYHPFYYRPFFYRGFYPFYHRGFYRYHGFYRRGVPYRHGIRRAALIQRRPNPVRSTIRANTNP